MKAKTNARNKKEMVYLCNSSRPEENTVKKILCPPQPIGSCLVQKFCLNSSKAIDAKEEGMETDSETMFSWEYIFLNPNQIK